MSDQQCTCLVPFYNESKRLPHTLAILTQVPEITHIICINDCSDEPETAQLIASLQKNFPEITLLELPTNQGKAGAIKAGLELVKTPWVLLLDADLQHLSANELSTTLQQWSNKQPQHNLDMLILRRAPYSKFVTAIRHDILMSGERIVRTKDLKKIFEELVFSGYQLEVACNHYMLEHKKSVRWVQTTLANTTKLQKWGVLKSLKKYKEELLGYTRFAGVRAYARQVFFFCRQPL